MALTREQKLGGLFAASAYTLWGIAPLYFKQIDVIPAPEILLHRIVWSFLLLFIVLLLLKQGRETLAVLAKPKLLAWLLLCAVLLGGNWGLFIWAVNNNHMLDASLGYYINPLLNVLLGMLFLGERLRKLQWLAVGLASVGVLWQIVGYGAVPWIALALASSFAVYGLLRKKLAVDAIKGLFIESLLLLPLALWYWWSYAASPAANLFENSVGLNLYLMAAGLVTTVPLLCFIAAARRLKLSTMGFFQYIGPTMMFIFGVWLYQEPFALERLFTFGLIWLALFCYSIDAWWANRRRKV
ncbi:chloramphenical resistance permease RarD [Alishewanella sp. WH16-1]|uniref:EamA family transporter RarD n=1 Tax=Alishewanella sp. WH16-1 TaxID=1651088 RepID=UPI000709D140|nr:EamA family transporter RarD [Alishewanella sp. WH16-1]KRS23068.1 chloramphenical resistance permease RarD [Alishewanella sp. WH16-1]